MSFLSLGLHLPFLISSSYTYVPRRKDILSLRRMGYLAIAVSYDVEAIACDTTADIASLAPAGKSLCMWYVIHFAFWGSNFIPVG